MKQTEFDFEYSNELVGFVITDNATNMVANVQFEQIQSNHPQPAFELACVDGSNENWNEERFEMAKAMLCVKSSTKELLCNYGNAFYKHRHSLARIQSQCNGLSASDIKYFSMAEFFKSSSGEVLEKSEWAERIGHITEKANIAIMLGLTEVVENQSGQWIAA